MCIWVDNNYDLPDCDDSLLYEYLYHLINMFAQKSKYFSKFEYYDEFALFGASRLFMRLKNKDLTKIKSVLNYIKTVIYPYKVEFEKDSYVNNTEDNELLYTDTFCLGSNLIDNSDIFDRIDFKYTLDNISNVIRTFLNKLPHKKNSSEWLNIYTSVLLTFNNMLSCADMKKMQLHDISSKELHSIYLDISKEEPILYHLDKNYSNYISILVNEIKSLIAKQLSIQNTSKVSSETALKSIIIASMDMED